MLNGFNLPRPSLTGTVNIPTPIGAGGGSLSKSADLPSTIKALPGAIAGKLKGLWQSIRGNAVPEHRVVDAGPGDYRLQRKGQTGYQRLDILGKAPAQPRATYASPEGARVRVLPTQAGSTSTSVTTSQPSGTDAPTALSALTARILTPTPAPQAQAAAKTLDEAIGRLVTQTAQRRDTEASVLADLDQLVRLADATGTSLQPAPGTPRSEAAKAFDMLVGKLMTLNVGSVGGVLRELAATGDDERHILEAAHRHVSGVAMPSAQVTRDTAAALNGRASYYDPRPEDLTDMTREEKSMLAFSRLLTAEHDISSTLGESVRSLGNSILALHRQGRLDGDTLKPLGDFQPLAALSQNRSPAQQLAAVPLLAQVMASVVKGAAGTINLLTAGDSRYDATALKLKTIGHAEGSPGYDKIAQQHALSRAKHQLASVWTQQEKVSRIKGSNQQLGGMGAFGTRMGKVINPGGSDSLRVNAQLLRALREGPAKADDARQGAGIQANARAGKDVNLLIAQVMLLQKHVDAQEVGDKVQDKRDALTREIANLPQPLQARLAQGLSREVLPASEAGGVIALGLATQANFDPLRQALDAERDFAEALLAATRLINANEDTSARAKVDLEGKNGVYTALVKEMKAVPQPPSELVPLTDGARLEAVIHQREQVAIQTRADAAAILNCGSLDDTEIRALAAPLQRVHELRAALAAAQQVAADASLGLSDKDLMEMGFSAEETQQVKQDLQTQLGHPIESLFKQGLRSTADAKKVTDAVNNGIDRLFVNGTSSLTQGTMRDVSKAFPEAAARSHLAAVLDAAHPVVGNATQESPDQVFGRVFGNSISAPDRPLSRLLQTTDAQVTAAQARMTTLVGELGHLDTRAATARQTLADLAGGTPPRKIDASSSSAQANATRIVAATDSMEALGFVREVIGEAQQNLTIIDNEIAGVQGQVHAADQQARTSADNVRTLTAAHAAAQTAVSQAAPDADLAALQTAERDAAGRLENAVAAHRGDQTELAQRQATLTNLQTQRQPLADALSQHQAIGARIQAKLDDQIKALGWMSQGNLERSILPQARISTVDDLNRFLAVPGNREAVDALHTLHGTPAAKEGKIRQLAEQAATADLALHAHQQVLASAPEGAVDPAQLQSAIRYALLETALAWPDGPNSFDPLQHRGAIEDRLLGWGLHKDVIRPEIDAVLHQKFDLAQIESWTKDATQAFHAPDAPAPGAARRALDAARTFVTDSSPLDIGTRRALIDSVRSMHVGDSLGLSRGLAWSLDTTPIPVEASGTLTAQVAIDMKSKNAMEVRRTEEGVEIVFKAGMKGAGALGIGATLFGAAKLTVTGRGEHESLSGAGLRFRDPEMAAKFLDTVLDGKKISPRLWATASETALVSDVSTLLGGEVSAKATVKNLASTIPSSEIVMKHLQYSGEIAGSSFEFLGGIQAKVGASREWRTEQQQNANGHVIEKSRSTVISGSVSVGIWASLPTVQDSVIDHFVDDNPVYTAIDNAVNRNNMLGGALGGKAQNYGSPDNHVFDPFSPASVKQASIELSAKRTLSESTSLAFEHDGMLSARGNTMTRSVVITGQATERDLALIQPGFSSKSVRTRGDDSLYNALAAIRANPESAGMLGELLASATRGSSLSVTYALKDDTRLVINDLMKRAEQAEQRKEFDRAAIFSGLAKSMYEDETNYAVDTIQVSKNTAVDNSVTLASVGIMSVGRVSEGSAQRPTMILAIPGGPTARGMVDSHAPAQPPSVDDSPEQVAHDSSVPPTLPAVLVDVQALADAIEPTVEVSTDTVSTGSDQTATVQTGSVQGTQTDVVPPPAPHAVATALQNMGTATLTAFDPVPSQHFHVETQRQSACAIHAFNAFVGGPAITINDFTNWVASRQQARSADTASAIEPENAERGFGPEHVLSALQLFQTSPAAHEHQWDVGKSDLSSGGQSGLHDVRLPTLANIDRLAVEVVVDSQARRDANAHPIDHFVAFRKDDQGQWWLLDSRDKEVHAPPGSTGSGEPIRRQIDPQDWIDEIISQAELRDLVIIGPGITGSDLIERQPQTV